MFSSPYCIINRLSALSLTTQLPGLYVLDTDNKGRAVYCAEEILAGSLIELCPVIVLSKQDTQAIHNTTLHDYYFMWDLEEGSSAIALGYGSLYNHSEKANAEFLIAPESREIKIMATADIPAGEEITLNYIALKESGVELWFDPK